MENSKANMDNTQTAKHLAARAVMALRSGFRVQSLTLDRTGNRSSGIVCDWKSGRASYNDDAKLIRRGFAFVYIGTIIDQKAPEAVSDTLRVELNSDMSSAQEAREAAVEWGLVPSVTDTNPFAHVGYKLASRLLRSDREAIEELSAQLFEKQTLTQSELDTWFKPHSNTVSLEDLEQSVTF